MGLLSRKKNSESADRHTCEVVIQNRNGLHARPAAMFVRISTRSRAEVWVEKDGERVNGKSIMGLMMLAAGQGSKLTIIAEGLEGEKVLAELTHLIESKFNEE